MNKKQYISFVRSKNTLNTVKNKETSDDCEQSATTLGEETVQQYRKILESKPSVQASMTKQSKNVKIEPKIVKSNLPSSRFKPKDIFDFAQNNKRKECQEWLQMKFDVNLRDQYNWTPLMVAACAGHATIVQLLLKHGADVSLVNNQEQTATELAQNEQHSHVISVITKHLESISSKQTNNYSEISNVGSDGKTIIKQIEPFQCKTCNILVNGMSVTQHNLSIEHQLKCGTQTEKIQNKIQSQANYNHLDPNYKGLQLLLKEGWSGHTGLGRHEHGRIYPVIPSVKSDRTCIGYLKPESSESNSSELIPIKKRLRQKEHRDKQIERFFRREFYE